MQLSTIAAGDGYRVDIYDVIGSTNDETLSRARQGDPGRLWIVAREQGRGRGRGGRTWVSPRGNLHASLLLVDPCPASTAPELGFVAGLALHDAVREHDVSAQRLGLKWPNDLLIDGAKVAGILLEGTAISGFGFAVALGLGVNVAHRPTDVGYATAALAGIAPDITVESLFERLTETFIARLAVWDGGRGFARIRRDWLDRAAGVGAPIVVRHDHGERRGVFHALDESGRLVVEEEGRLVTIAAGDVVLSTTSPLTHITDSQGGGR